MFLSDALLWTDGRSGTTSLSIKNKNDNDTFIPSKLTRRRDCYMSWPSAGTRSRFRYGSPSCSWLVDNVATMDKVGRLLCDVRLPVTPENSDNKLTVAVWRIPTKPLINSWCDSQKCGDRWTLCLRSTPEMKAEVIKHKDSMIDGDERLSGKPSFSVSPASNGIDFDNVLSLFDTGNTKRRLPYLQFFSSVYTVMTNDGVCNDLHMGYRWGLDQAVRVMRP